MSDPIGVVSSRGVLTLDLEQIQELQKGGLVVLGEDGRMRAAAFDVTSEVVAAMALAANAKLREKNAKLEQWNIDNDKWIRGLEDSERALTEERREAVRFAGEVNLKLSKAAAEILDKDLAIEALTSELATVRSQRDEERLEWQVERAQRDEAFRRVRSMMEAAENDARGVRGVRDQIVERMHELQRRADGLEIELGKAKLEIEGRKFDPKWVEVVDILKAKIIRLEGLDQAIGHLAHLEAHRERDEESGIFGVRVRVVEGDKTNMRASVQMTNNDADRLVAGIVAIVKMNRSTS